MTQECEDSRHKLSSRSSRPDQGGRRWREPVSVAGKEQAGQSQGCAVGNSHLAVSFHYSERVQVAQCGSKTGAPDDHIHPGLRSIRPFDAILGEPPERPNGFQVAAFTGSQRSLRREVR